SIASPVIADTFLDTVLDQWFGRVVKRHCRGYGECIRYADARLTVFPYEEDYAATLPHRVGPRQVDNAVSPAAVTTVFRNIVRFDNLSTKNRSTYRCVMTKSPRPGKLLMHPPTGKLPWWPPRQTTTPWCDWTAYECNLCLLRTEQMRPSLGSARVSC